MAKRSKNPPDMNAMARSIVDKATTDAPDPDDGKDPAAVELGRRGGKKGGPARAKKLSPTERSAIARNAAEARWQRGQAG
jgi:hypothetical protein